ncbi:MAG: DHH family phosphoesterase [Spirochaetales bacterium]
MKTSLETIAERNRVVQRIISALDERDGFLVTGHKSVDEDCLAAMVAFALIANKFAKTATILVEGPIHENLDFLVRICRYNAIEIVESLDEAYDFDTVVICDTAKPDLLAHRGAVLGVLADPNIQAFEIDHHLESDSEYLTDRDHALVDQATSASELVGLVAYKLSTDQAFLEERQVFEIFTRNVVLAILTGVIGDTQMGKFLHNRKERRMYVAYTEIFGSMLFEKTQQRSNNFASVERLFSELRKLSRREEECFDYLYALRTRDGAVSYLNITENQYRSLVENYGNESLSTVLRTVADSLAEDSGRLSLVVFSGRPEGNDLLQCRARRSKHYKKVDLRKLLERLQIENGGGHQGAIGFRIPLDSVPHIDSFVAMVVESLNAMVRDADAA